MRTKIYSLQDENENIRYIGKTCKKLQERLLRHLGEARRGVRNHRCNWVRSVLSRGKLINIFLIGEVDGNGCKEEIAWIKYFKDEGVKLVNGTDGGEGGLGRKFICSAEHRVKIGNALRGKHHSEEVRKHMRHAQSAETCKKISDAQRGKSKNLSEESRLKCRNAQLGKVLSLEHRRKMSVSQKARWIKYAQNKNIFACVSKHDIVRDELSEVMPVTKIA